MAIKYGYFNSVNGDRKYNAEDMTMYFKGLVSDGIFQTIGDMFVVTAGDGLTVTVGTGRALVNTHWIENTTVLKLNLGSASVSSDVYKMIVLRCDLSDNIRSVSIITKSNTSGAIILTNNDTITELCIARVCVRKNATAVSQSDIRDCRGSSYCPWITGLINQVDISQLNEQFYKYYEEQTAELNAYMQKQKDEFDEWLSTLQNELTVNTTLKKYQSTYTTTSETTEIPLISQYESGDSLLVHIGGILFVEGDEFTIDTENKKIELFSSIIKDSVVTQILIKSIIGGTSWFTVQANDTSFSWGKSVISVDIPPGTRAIGEAAFNSCTNLESVTIPNSVTTIAGGAFAYCTSLTNIDIPNSVTLIGGGAFAECTKLTELVVPNSVTTIGEDAFKNVAKIIYSGTATGAPWGAKEVVSE